MIWGTLLLLHFGDLFFFLMWGFFFRMELEEAKETFGYFIKEANKLKIAYIILVRYDIDSAPSFDGKYPLIYI